ncbi:MAG: OmpA family protein [Pseudomonadota bacterium]|nr:OmpA family protein [Pseudomonadota bacterium]
MFQFKTNICLFMVAIALAACTSDPKVAELPITSDPQVELDRVDGNIRQAQSQQVDVLSPKNFEAAKNSLNKATKARAANKDQKDVLHKIAVAQAYLDKANVVANVANQILKGTIDARQDALNAKAIKFYPNETAELDKTFKKLTLEVEDNDSSGVEGNRGKLEAKYRALELNSIKKEKLGPAQADIKEAIKEGAEKLTPETLAWANKRYAEDLAIIETQRHNTVGVDKASADATAAAHRLLKMVRNAKGSTQKNPEELAKQIEKNELAAVQSENDLSLAATELNQAANELANSKGKLASASAQNDKLESQVWLDNVYNNARNQFTNDEAEVYKQGDKLLLRLKGLSFVKNNAGISSTNFPLLAKVQKVISDVGSSQIAIEGHTDSVGAKKLNEELSTKRAEAVQSYLVANNNVAPNKITATGHGYSKPIATNKTAEGRAQNRRVDVIITAEPAK